jgi:hypothetical protein
VSGAIPFAPIILGVDNDDFPCVAAPTPTNKPIDPRHPKAFSHLYFQSPFPPSRRQVGGEAKKTSVFVYLAILLIGFFRFGWLITGRLARDPGLSFLSSLFIFRERNCDVARIDKWRKKQGLRNVLQTLYRT